MIELYKPVLDGKGVPDEGLTSVLVPIFKRNGIVRSCNNYRRVKFYLLAIFILHSRESELYRYVLNGMFALVWELLSPKCLVHLSFTGGSVWLSALPKDATGALSGLFSTITLNVERPVGKL